MNYDDLMRQARLAAVRAFFKQHNIDTEGDYLDWFYANFLGICKNLGYLYGNKEPLDSSPYAQVALQIYALRQ